MVSIQFENLFGHHLPLWPLCWSHVLKIPLIIMCSADLACERRKVIIQWTEFEIRREINFPAEPSGHGLPHIKCFSLLSNACLLSVLFLLYKAKSGPSAPHLTSQMSIFHTLFRPRYLIAFLPLMFFWSIHPIVSPSLHSLIIDAVSSALSGYLLLFAPCQ